MLRFPKRRPAIISLLLIASLAGSFLLLPVRTVQTQDGATDRWRLARSPVQRSDGLEFFRHKVRGGMRLEDDVRRLANRVRYLGASA